MNDTRDLVHFAGHSDEFYGRPKEYIVQADMLNHLLRMEIVLEHLKKHNVHMWDGYDAAMESAEEELKG